MVKDSKLGIIGGSGIYDLETIRDLTWEKVDTPFGAPSDELLFGSIDDTEIVFLPRHGRGHVLSPSEVPYAANIYALKSVGVTDILAVSACGSLKAEMKPGDFVLVDQFIDRTIKRQKSFFGNGCVAHVSLAEPTCIALAEKARMSLDHCGITFHQKATYLAMEGPQFSTRAESIFYKNGLKCDVIGMTNMPEAKLAREAEICYLPVAMVTDFDCWHDDHDNVTMDNIVRTLLENAENAKKFLSHFISNFPHQRAFCTQGCDTALDNAVVTKQELWPESTEEKLGVILGRVLS